MARRIRLTPLVQEAVVRVLRNGGTRTSAAGHVGVSRETFYRWLNTRTTFRDAVEKAEHDCDVDLVVRIKAAAVGGDWKAAQWLLEHHPRTRADWRANIDVNVSQLDAMQVEVTHRLDASALVNPLVAIRELAEALDIVVGVGGFPALGAGGAGGARAVAGAEVDEVHPAKPGNGRAAV